MLMIKIKKYTSDDSREWDRIIEKSRSGTFLHYRNYMDYHSDRFKDFSLIISRAEKPVAVFPATVVFDTVHSHAGLTYGGLFSLESLCADDALQTFHEIGKYYREQGMKKVIVKSIPYPFYRYPCQEDLYALFRVGAKLTRRDASSVLALNAEFKYSKGRKWSINKARKAGVVVKKTSNPMRFHELLTGVLKKFETTPTHSLAELILLMSRFPDNILLYEAEISGNLLAGTIIYDFGDIVHTQYLATSDGGRDVGALDFLISDLIEDVYPMRKYFSFGVSTEQQGIYLNTGLIAHKEGFGARTVVHDFYEWIL